MKTRARRGAPLLRRVVLGAFPECEVLLQAFTWLWPYGGDGVQVVLHLFVLQLKRHLERRLAQDVEVIGIRSSLHQLLRHADRPAGRRQHQRAPARALLTEVHVRAPFQQQPDRRLVSVLSGGQQRRDLQKLLAVVAVDVVVPAGVSLRRRQVVEVVHEGAVFQQEFGHVSVTAARRHGQDAGAHPVPAVDLCAVLQQDVRHVQMAEPADGKREESVSDPRVIIVN